jgi:hypothetical protein
MNATICECGKTCFAPTSQWCVVIVDAEDGWLLRKYLHILRVGIGHHLCAVIRTPTKQERAHCSIEP